MRDQKGLSVVALVLTILLMAVFGTVLISLVGTGVTSSVKEQAATQSAYLTEGAHELSLRWAIDNIEWGENGLSPQTANFPDTTFGWGSFTVSSVYALTAIANAATSFMSPTSTSVTVNDTSVFPAAGALRIDGENMTYAAKTPTSFTGLTRGVGSAATGHYQRTPVYPAAFLSAGALATETTVSVSDTTGFLGGGTVQIDAELMDYSGKTPTSFTGLTRGTHGTTPAAHALGSVVWPGMPQCEVTTTGTVGTAGDIKYGVRVMRQAVDFFIAANFPGLITTVAGNGVGGYTGEGAATAVRVNSPQGVAVDRQGLFLYIADTANHRVRRVDLSSGIISTVAGSGMQCAGQVACGGNDCGDGGDALLACLNAPQDVAVSADGLTLYVADTGRNKVRRVDLTAGTINHFAGDLIGRACGGQGFCGGVNCGDGNPAIGPNVCLNNPRGVAVDSTGIVYVTDTGRHRIRRVRTDGIIERVAGSGAGNLPANPPPDFATRFGARFRQPEGVAVGLNENLIYVADTQTGPAPSKVRIVSLSANTVMTVAGINASGFAGDGGAATAARLNKPQAVDVDNAGNLYIADTDNHRVRKVAPGADGVVTGAADEIISTVAGTGAPAYNGDDIDATAANLDTPSGVAMDYRGNFYVGDTNHHRIRKVTFTRVENIVLEEVDWREMFQ